MDASPTDDSRLLVGAYLASDRELYEVVARRGGFVLVENCRTGFRVQLQRETVLEMRSIVPEIGEVRDVQ